MATFKEFRNNVKPNWCPGCGDFSIQAAIQRAAANVGLEPEGSRATLTRTAFTASTDALCQSRKALSLRTAS
jgi:pyruvate/2-oxoacid:ferredoxin oxidoreductase beta subunit